MSVTCQSHACHIQVTCTALTIDSLTVWALGHLPGFLIDLFGYVLASQSRQAWPPQGIKKLVLHLSSQEYVATGLGSIVAHNTHHTAHPYHLTSLFTRHTSGGHLANDLQDADDAPEVANVEDRQLKLNVAIVTSAVGQALPTCLTHSILGAGALVQGDSYHVTCHMTHDVMIIHCTIEPHTSTYEDC